jgi:hypothetical protein
MEEQMRCTQVTRPSTTAIDSIPLWHYIIDAPETF